MGEPPPLKCLFCAGELARLSVDARHATYIALPAGVKATFAVLECGVCGGQRVFRSRPFVAVVVVPLAEVR